MATRDEKKQRTIILIAIIVGIFFISNMMKPAEPEIKAIIGEWDISKEVEAEGYEIYLMEEPDFDYSTPIVFNMAQTIKTSTSTPDEAVKQTIKMVAQNIKYSSAVTVNYCYNEKASTVAESGIGDCVSMSRLVVALLRAQGIPARTKGGCLSMSKKCVALFATVPTLQPQVTPMAKDDFKKRGYLHEWVEVWLPDKTEKGGTWKIIEATSGQIFSTSCYTKAYLEYGYDTNQYERCIISSNEFWNQCKIY